MKKILSILILFCSVGLTAQNNPLLDSANNAYAKNKFADAVKYYDQIINAGYESADLHYNLGNAHFKNKQLALAILNYEKAKKLAPADEDNNYNLKLANGRLTDKIEALPQLFIKDWWNNFLLFLSPKTWSWICITLIWLGFAGLVLFFVSGSRMWKQLGFTGGLLSFLLALVFFIVAGKSNAISSSHNEGIVLTPSINIKGSPSEQGTNLFILHEGSKVTIEQSNADWLEIKIANGNRGWIKSAEIAVI